MKIALPYDRGRINPHFGHTQYIEVYTVEDGKQTGKMMLPCAGSGHKYMCSLMKKLGVNVVLAGMMGKPAILGLKELGIDTYIGLQGSTENAVYAFIEGELRAYNVKLINLDELEDSCDCH